MIWYTQCISFNNNNVSFLKIFNLVCYVIRSGDSLLFIYYGTIQRKQLKVQQWCTEQPHMTNFIDSLIGISFRQVANKISHISEGITQDNHIRLQEDPQTKEDYKVKTQSLLFNILVWYGYLKIFHVYSIVKLRTLTSHSLRECNDRKGNAVTLGRELMFRSTITHTNDLIQDACTFQGEEGGQLGIFADEKRLALNWVSLIWGKTRGVENLRCTRN